MKKNGRKVNNSLPTKRVKCQEEKIVDVKTEEKIGGHPMKKKKGRPAKKS
jgi:hypothetical protein